MAELTKINLDSIEYDIHDAKPHGTLTAPLVVTGGDATTAGKISLDKTTSGQITDESTSTLFGFLSNGTSDLTIGGSSLNLRLRGALDRPTYKKGSNGTEKTLALSEDLPTNPLTLSDKSSYNCNTRYDGKIWLIGNGSNCPSVSPYGALLMMPYRQATGNSKPDYGAQIFLPNGDDGPNEETGKRDSMFYRTSMETSWRSWQEVAVEGKCNADKIDGYHVSVVSTLPASPDSNTIYIIT